MVPPPCTMPPAAFVNALPDVPSVAPLATSIVPLFGVNTPDCSVPALTFRVPELLNDPLKPSVLVPLLLFVTLAPAWLLNTTEPPEQQLSQPALFVMLNCAPGRLLNVVVPLAVRMP